MGYCNGGTSSGDGCPRHDVVFQATPADMGTGTMVVEDEEKREMDILPSGLLPGTGKDAAAAQKLRSTAVDPSQFRP